MMAFSGVTSQCEERGFRRSAGTNFEIAIAVVPAGTKCFSPLRKTTGRWSVNHEQLEAIDHYERRALSRRRFAIRAFDLERQRRLPDVSADPIRGARPS